MKIITHSIEHNTLNANVLIEADEIRTDNTAVDLYIGEACRKTFERLAVIPVGEPEITRVDLYKNRSMSFSFHITLCPDVSADQYKGIRVPQNSETDETTFAEAVRAKGAGYIDIQIPEAMLSQKMEALVAEEKIMISQDPIYHVLADITNILKKAYAESGASRSMAQIRAEAMDIMLLSLSGDARHEPRREALYQLIAEAIKKYRPLPDAFEKKLDTILERRREQNKTMTPEERAEEAFSAYLGSLNVKEDKWRESHREKAGIYVRFDLLLDQVAQKEGIEIRQDELHSAHLQIAAQCGVDYRQVIQSIDSDSLEWKLKREKAEKIILAHVIRE